MGRATPKFVGIALDLPSDFLQLGIYLRIIGVIEPNSLVLVSSLK
jgi:hypothetical protein